jgi:cellulose synthase/poly-beta-1,6-N-acetylglucosamine synthase-like glycosyltransferase
MNEPKISVVVIGRNEGERLTRCLRSLSFLEADVIYVDSASTDNSPQSAASLGAEVIVLEEGVHTAARARNAGWQRARTPYVLFLDGDTVLKRGFPAAALRVLESDERIASAWGHRRESRPEHSLYNRVLDLDWIYAPGTTEYCGGDALMRRDALEAVGGFDASLIAGEEPELCRRLRAHGYRIEHIDVPMTAHDLNITRFRQYWLHSVRAGHAYAEISHRFRNTGDPMWLRESNKNYRSAAFWLLWFLVASLLVLCRSMWAIPWLAVLPLLAARSAWKNRWKIAGRPGLLLLYGLHSHAQQIPVCVGQLRYLLNRRSALIEYKESAKV